MAFADDFVDLVTAEITHISLHTASPGTTGASEVTGGSPAYARLVPTYNASASSSADITTTLEFNGPDNGGPVTHVGYWRGANFWIGRGVSTSRSFNSDGRLNLSSAPVSGTVSA